MSGKQQDTVNQRLSILVDELEGGSKANFASKVGVAVQSIHDLIGGRQGMPSFKLLSSILEKYPTVDANWLVSGRGSMLQGITSASTDATAINATLTESQFQEVLPQIIQQLVNNPEWINKMASKGAAAQVEAAVLSRTYHLENTMSAVRGYDDRLSGRIGLPVDELRKLLDSGDLRGKKAGTKYIVSEQAVREFLGEA